MIETILMAPLPPPDAAVTLTQAIHILQEEKHLPWFLYHPASCPWTEGDELDFLGNLLFLFSEEKAEVHMKAT